MLERLQPVHSLRLKFIQRQPHYLLWGVDAQRLNVELEHVFLLANVGSLRKLLMADALPTRCALVLVFDCSSHFFAHILNVENAHGTKRLKLFGIVTLDWLSEPDIGHQSVVGCADRGPLSVCLADPFLANKLHLDLLPWSQFRDQDVIMQGSRWIFLKSLGLVTNWNPFQVA